MQTPSAPEVFVVGQQPVYHVTSGAFSMVVCTVAPSTRPGGGLTIGCRWMKPDACVATCHFEDFELTSTKPK